MKFTHAVNGLVGFGTGFLFASNKTKENEAKQGKNYYLAALFQSSQFFIFGAVINQMAKVLPLGSTRRISLLCNVVPLLSVPACLLFATIKQGDYTKLAKFWNKKKWLPGKLPESLTNRIIIRITHFLAEHTGDILRIAMLVSTVAMIFLGNPILGGGALIAMGYEAIDNIGWVSRKISLFMETYMPIVANASMLFRGTILTQFLSGSVLLTALPVINRFCLKKMDLILKKCFGLRGPTLEEIDAPIVTNMNPSFETINNVLNNSENCFEIDPRHCSKWTQDLSKLPTNRHFNHFFKLYDTIHWENKYALIRGKLKDDERFIDFLKDKNPGIKLEDLQQNFDHYMDRLAHAENVTKEQYASRLLRKKMVALVRVLEGNGRVRGLQRDLSDAMDNCSKILPYLQTLDPRKERVELEDALMKLAVEGGDYCARGIKRVTSELISTILQKNLEAGQTMQEPIKEYESKIRRALQEQRFKVVQKNYQDITKLLSRFPNAIKNDIHTFDIYRTNLMLGMVPLTDLEKRDFGLAELGKWESYAIMRKSMYSDYKKRLHEVVRQIGHADFGLYILNTINQNNSLTSNQKMEILEKLTERNSNQWSLEETQQRFNRLMFVMLGILRMKSSKDLIKVKAKEMFLHNLRS